MTSTQARIEIDLDNFQLRKDGRHINLTRIEWALLRELTQHKGQALSHDHLLQKGWGSGYENEDNYVHIYIAKLRKKLEDDPKKPQYLFTVPGIGYRWVEPEASDPNSSVITPSLPGVSAPHLPVPPASFVGREEDIAILEDLLPQCHIRLLSLTGPGGIGKTRLALELAKRFRDTQFFAHGVYFIDLAPVDNPDLVVSAIAQALGVPEKAGEHLLSLLKHHLQDKNALVVLDNFEQVISASGQISEILIAAKGVKFLITSREKLNLYGEQDYDVPPLPWNQPDPTSNDAVRLFTERAQLVNRRFSLTDENLPVIRQICEQLDGLPLAIELAAVTIKSMSPSLLLERLSSRLTLLVEGQSNLPIRHQTLQATIDWSFQRLSAQERRLFIALSIFSSSFTPEAVEAVCSDEIIPRGRVRSTLKSLFHKNLITSQWDESQDEPRYTLLGSFREFASEHIEKKQAECLNQLHAEYSLQLLEKLNQLPKEQAYKLLTVELSNLRAALRWAIANKASRSALRICVGMYGWWLNLRTLKEGQQSFIESLEIPSDEVSPLRAHALYCAGVLSDWLGEYRVGQGLYRECLRIYEFLQDAAGTIIALVTLGSTLISQGDFEEGRTLSEQSLKLAREQNNPVAAAQALNNLGMLAIYQGEAETAHAIYSEKYALWKALKDEQGAAWALTGLSWAELLQGKFHAAQKLIIQSLELHQRSGNILGTALAQTCDSWIALYKADFDDASSKLESCLALCKDLGVLNLIIWPMTAIGLVNLYHGRLTESRVWLDDALQLCQRLDQPPFTPWVHVALGKLLRCEGQSAAACDYLQHALTLGQKRDNKSILAAVLEEFAANFAVQNQTELAIQLYGAAHALRETYHMPLSPLDHLEYDVLTASLTANPTVDWKACWLKGAALSRSEVTQIIIDGTRSLNNFA
jgi:predicted ATPase/DNA-binding winged helix-turn-helix (wHTH) protein